MVLGLGNPLRGDDAAGLKVAGEVARLLEKQPLPGVEVCTSTRGGFELIELLAGSRHAVIVDCLAAVHPEPGRIRRLTLDACRGSSRLVGAHDLSLSDTFDLARAAGHQMPEEVEIYGIEAEETLEITEALSPAVARAVDVLAREIYTRLRSPDGVQSP